MVKTISPYDSAGACAQVLAQRYLEVRALTERLTETLTIEDQMLQSMEDASPAKWHLAHTSWFFENFVLKPHLPTYREFHEIFHHLFNSYYQAAGTPFARPQRGMLSRPNAQQVLTWRRHVDAAICQLIEQDPPDEVLFLITLGIHHEQQHQELLLTDIKHAFFQNPLLPAYRPCVVPCGEITPLRWHGFDGGLVDIGWAEQGFAFDNETPRHTVFLQPFQLSSRLVTNEEYLAFMQEGGYERSEFWLAEGWSQLQHQHRRSPLYWQERGGEWFQFTHGGVQALSLAAPVSYVTFFEASAYAAWAGARLPTEQEWEHAAASADFSRGRFLDLAVLAPQPAISRREGPSQLLGDCWEWTASAYTPYPGYRPFDGTVAEYNGKFMSGQMVLRGGSCLTPRNHLRTTYRNFFPPSAGWQCSGIRLAKTA